MGSVARPPSAAAICYDGEMTPRELLSGLYQFDDECNVYVVVRGGGAVAIDFGSGRWLDQYATSGLPTIEHVFLTHHHSDQCAGLEGRSDWPFVIHAPIGDLPSISPQGVADYWQHRSDAGVPRSYDVLRRGIEHVSFDMAGFSDMIWRGGRVRCIHTPGPTRTAISVLMDIGRKQVLFCGDAAHAGATIHKPYMLEWDHWTGEGALAAFEGVERMRGLGIDLLCPAHGPVVTDSIRPMLGSLSKRLLDLYRVKGSICAGERDRYVTPTWTDDGALRITPGLYSTGGNTYVLQSASGEVMVVDPWRGENDALRALLEKLGNPRITAATATHYHADHCDMLNAMRDEFGALVLLHPRVAQPIADPGSLDVPWLPKEPIRADQAWPGEGNWSWNEYTFDIAPLAGQTWWHCGFCVTIDGVKVAFTGDSFQPPSRWNGTGGFCSFNGSRFETGFVRSARRVMAWKPNIIAAGHGTFVHYRASYFRKVIHWAARAEAAVKALCPSGRLEDDYYRHNHR